MKLLIAFLMILFSSSCTLRKKEQLKNIAYNLGDNSKLIVNSLKRSKDRLEFKLLAICNGADQAVIKASEIDCGVGSIKFKKVMAQSNAEDLIVIPKRNYVEFDIICKNDKDVSEADDLSPFLTFKKIYKFDAEKQGAPTDENITIKFE